MKIGGLTVNWMGRTNDNIRLWLDVNWRGYWYVLHWRKNAKAYCYRSKDATPPTSDNDGKYFFGRAMYGD